MYKILPFLLFILLLIFLKKVLDFLPGLWYHTIRKGKEKKKKKEVTKMKNIWTEIMFVDRRTVENWTAYYIGTEKEVIEALTEELKNEPCVFFESLGQFEVED